MQSCNRIRRDVNWQNLPEQAVKSVVKSIGNDVEALRQFRSVCRSWRQSTAYNIPPSLLVDHNKSVFSSVFLIRPCGSTSVPWMVTAIWITGGLTLFFHPFYGTPLVNVPASLDLSPLCVSCVSSACHCADFDSVVSLFGLFAASKELLVLSENVSDKGVLYQMMRRGDYTNEETDDVVNFYFRYFFRLDRKGNLYRVYTNCESLVFNALYESEPDDDLNGCRKRLVVRLVPPSAWKLYVVVRMKQQMFKVYELSRQNNIPQLWDRVEVQSFGEKGVDDLVLFVTRDNSFFASAKDFPGCQLSNCIVFSHDAFPPYSNADLELPRDGRGIYVYQLGGTDHAFVPISLYPGFPLHLWSPPPWVMQGSVSQPQSKPNKDQTNQVKQLVQNCQGPQGNAPLQEKTQHESTPSSGIISEKQIIAIHPANREIATGTSTINAPMHVTQEGPRLGTLRDGMMQSVSGPYKTSINQPTRNNDATSMFQGIDVQPEHLPVLEKIWMKYGDVFEGTVVRSRDTKTTALASLAKMVLILQTNSGNSLTREQAQYLDSTLFDLQYMHMRVEWLAPFVKRALAIHQNRQLQTSLTGLEKAKARVEEMERELAEVKQGLDNELRLLSRSMSVSGRIEEGKHLGKRLC